MLTRFVPVSARTTHWGRCVVFGASSSTPPNPAEPSPDEGRENSALPERVNAQPGAKQDLKATWRTLRAMVRRADWEHAIPLLNQLDAQGFGNAAMELGKIHLLRGDTAAAEAVFRKAADGNPRFSLPYLGLAQVHKARGEYRQALRAAEKALILNPDNYHARLEAGNLSATLKNYPRATYHYHKVKLTPPLESTLYNNLGVVLARQGEYFMAEESLREAIFHNPHNADYLNNLGGVMLLSGNAPLATRHYKAALQELNREDGAKPKDKQTAAQLARVRRNLASAYDAFAAKRRKEGKEDVALKYFEKAAINRFKADLLHPAATSSNPAAPEFVMEEVSLF